MDRLARMSELDKRMAAGVAIGEKLEAQHGPTSPVMDKWLENFSALSNEWHALEAQG